MASRRGSVIGLLEAHEPLDGRQAARFVAGLIAKLEGWSAELGRRHLALDDELPTPRLARWILDVAQRAQDGTEPGSGKPRAVPCEVPSALDGNLDPELAPLVVALFEDAPDLDDVAGELVEGLG